MLGIRSAYFELKPIEGAVPNLHLTMVSEAEALINGSELRPARCTVEAKKSKAHFASEHHSALEQFVVPDDSITH
jgi:hypothetical protein